jgi:protein-disulfide isomerase
VQSAVALECAASQGAQNPFLDLVYQKQDSIGLKSWRSYAEEARVADLPRFLKCITEPPPTRIESGRKWAARLEITSTPTILLNGWRFVGLPAEKDLVDAIDALLAGQTPFWQADNVAKDR